MLRRHYTHFLTEDRVLLTGHSHQAWPDCAREAVLACYDDAARHVDDKWSLAFEAADDVRRAVCARMGGAPDDVALAGNTHELVVRFLSALPLTRKRHLVSTDGEFHSIDRQLRRLAEEGIALTRVAAHPVDTLAERLADAIRHDTAAVLTSTVLFETSERVPHLDTLAALSASREVALLLDAYHAFNVVHFDRARWPMAFVVSGGYKYAQWGEGVCFMSVPAGCTLRPAYTGWFSDFAHLGNRRDDVPVTYGNRSADRFAGATYDPVSHYRARAVARFFDAQQLDTVTLEACSQQQTTRLIEALDAHGWATVTPRESSRRGGFVSVRVNNASDVVAAMRRDGVFVDARGDLLRFGPAPYLTDDELDRGVAAFVRAVTRT